MTPQELARACVEAMERWNSGDQLGAAPFVMLTVPRAKAPTGRTIRLGGRIGPTGRIATCHHRPHGFDVVAYFPAIPILEAMGIKVSVKRVKA